MDPRFIELCENRKAYVQIAKKNGFYEGLKQLLTRLYPDSAHFVFELLQNAEDANAEEVRFSLYPDRLEFEHDGKRLFDYSDVESITGISQSTKKDDGTTIGKFGIGFKSIYAYTSMPDIYSGEYRFSISEMFIPQSISSAQETHPGMTLFVLPFDNPDKDEEKAYSEIAEALDGLNPSSLLFLKNIKTIRYSLGEGRTGMIARQENGPLTSISWTGHGGKRKTKTFLRFQKEVEIEDDNGELKVCTIGIAYKVKNPDLNKDQDEPMIVPMNRGVVSIYFPAAKETSNLKFNINASFAATTARDSVKSCASNDRLRDALAELAVESIRAIRDLGLLNMDFLACMPNEKDDLPPFYEPIRQRIVQAFREEDLTPMRRNGGYAPANILRRAPARISDVFPDAQFSKLVGLEDERVWAANAPQRNQREDNFLDSLDMDEWSWDDLASLICDCDRAYNTTLPYSIYTEMQNVYQECAERLERMVSTSSDDWVFSFYALLGEAINKHDRIISCQNLKLIRTKDKHGISHVTPAEAHLPEAGVEVNDADAMYVKPEAYQKQKREKDSSNALAFLQEVGVRQYDIHERVRLKLEQYKTEKWPDETSHLEDLRFFMTYVQQGGDADIFRDVAFLLGIRDGKRDKYKPSEIAIDEPWQKTGLAPIAKDIGKYNIANIYEREFWCKSDTREEFRQFLRAIGCSHALAVERASSIPWEIKDKMRNWGNITEYRIEEDYVIEGLEKILSSLTVERSRLIWECLLNSNDRDSECRYRPNASRGIAKADATFIRQLKDAAWLPDKNGRFHKPREITLNALHDLFVYTDYKRCIEALGIGADAAELKNQREQEEILRKEQDEQARKEGFESQSEKELCAQFANMLRNQGRSMREVLERELPKRTKPEFPQARVENPERRKQKISERANEAPTKTYESRSRSIRTSRSMIEPRNVLRDWYTNKNDEMICQICRDEMPFRDRNGDYYFEAVELFTSELMDKENEAMYIALCPTCAAKYKEFVKTDTKAMKKLLNDIHYADFNTDEFTINLDNKNEVLHFVEKHWFDIVQILDINGN